MVVNEAAAAFELYVLLCRTSEGILKFLLQNGLHLFGSEGESDSLIS